MHPPDGQDNPILRRARAPDLPSEPVQPHWALGSPLMSHRPFCRAFVAILLVALAAGCSGVVEALHASPTRVTARDPGGLYPDFLFERARVVAIGDIHGDLQAARRALRLAGAIDEKDQWIGGDLVVVQLGDVLDRADEEREIMDLLQRLEVEAKRKGGRLIQLIGNHEAMNAQGDFRYVTAAGMADFDTSAGLDLTAPGVAMRADVARARRVAFKPGGLFARRLARLAVVVRVGSTVFVHAGLLPRYASVPMASLNKASRMWLQGGGPFPEWMDDANGPLWTRAYTKNDAGTCATLGEALALLKASRMVIGHTVYKNGIESACDGALWRIDTGMSRAFGGVIQALEIKRERVKILGEEAVGAP